MSDDSPAAILATTGQVRTMADGSLRLSIEIPPGQAKQAFTMFGAPGTPVALARLTNESATQHEQKKIIEGAKGPYGDAYVPLYKVGFWFAPQLHEALGITGEVEHLRAQDASPYAISDLVKGAFYQEFGVDSLSHVPPENFATYLEGLGIRHLLPKEFGQ